jgi:hypothetical protein
MASRGNASAGSGPLVEGVGNAFLQGLDVVLLLLVDPGLVLDGHPQLRNIILDLLNIDSHRNCVATGHFLDVGLQFTDIFTNNLRTDDISFGGDFNVRCSGESH